MFFIIQCAAQRVHMACTNRRRLRRPWTVKGPSSDIRIKRRISAASVARDHRAFRQPVATTPRGRRQGKAFRGENAKKGSDSRKPSIKSLIKRLNQAGIGRTERCRDNPRASRYLPRTRMKCKWMYQGSVMYERIGFSQTYKSL